MNWEFGQQLSSAPSLAVLKGDPGQKVEEGGELKEGEEQDRTGALRLLGGCLAQNKAWVCRCRDKVSCQCPAQSNVCSHIPHNLGADDHHHVGHCSVPGPPEQVWPARSIFGCPRPSARRNGASRRPAGPEPGNRTLLRSLAKIHEGELHKCWPFI